MPKDSQLVVGELQEWETLEVLNLDFPAVVSRKSHKKPLVSISFPIRFPFPARLGGNQSQFPQIQEIYKWFKLLPENSQFWRKFELSSFLREKKILWKLKEQFSDPKIIKNKGLKYKIIKK